ncbi:MAG TPA: MFS transporter [Acidimicrobiales bacterium]|nr:MFS transporter [Acidimicrobiales bacterium]
MNMSALSQKTFSSLRVRNYRLFFFGQLVSMCGTWMQSVGQVWLVLRLTGSGVAVGVVTALQFLPILIFGVWGGVVADRVDKRKALMVTQASMGVIAAVLAVITATGVVRLWMVYVCALALGVANLFDNPIRQAFVTEMVGPAEVTNAVALNSAMFNAARVVGPGLAGVLIVSVGLWPCFAINAASFIAVIIGLMVMRPAELYRAAPVMRAKGQIRAGLRYVWASRRLRTTILLVAIVGTFALNFTITMPLMAKYAFHGDAGTFSLLTVMMGFGSTIGALVTAARARPDRRLLMGSCTVFGIVMLLAAVAPTLRFELLVMPLFGAASITFMATANSILQLNSSPEMRGRVMALYGLVFLGSTPIGGPLVGWIAEVFGPRASVAVGGVACLFGAALVALLLRRTPPHPAAAPTPEEAAELAAEVLPDSSDVAGAVPRLAPVAQPSPGVDPRVVAVVPGDAEAPVADQVGLVDAQRLR